MNNVSSPLSVHASAYYNDLLRPLFSDRKFLIAGPIAVGLGDLARRLTGLGAERPFLIAGSEGTGALPTREEAELHVLHLASKDILEEQRNLQHVIDDPPSDLRGAIDAWDPTESARFIFSSPLAASRTAAPRLPYGARPAAWAALEDKVQIDAFWDAAGVPRAPSRIVPADYEAIRTTATALDRGLGTVWAADARDGTHGGGLGLRWVRPGDDGRASYDSLRRMADRVRVMPFLEGIPASIHGIVFRTTWPCSDPSRWSYSVRQTATGCSSRVARPHSIRIRTTGHRCAMPPTGPAPRSVKSSTTAILSVSTGFSRKTAMCPRK